MDATHSILRLEALRNRSVWRLQPAATARRTAEPTQLRNRVLPKQPQPAIMQMLYWRSTMAAQQHRSALLSSAHLDGDEVEVLVLEPLNKVLLLLIRAAFLFLLAGRHPGWQVVGSFSEVALKWATGAPAPAATRYDDAREQIQRVSAF